MTPTGKFVVSKDSSPEEFADKVVEQARGLHERSILGGREAKPVSEEYLTEMRKDLISRCVMQGTVGDPQAKF